MTPFRYSCIYCIICVTMLRAVAREKCDLPNGEQGYCSNIHHCESAKEELKLKLKPTLCRFERDTPIVCCSNSITPASGIKANTSARNRIKFEEAVAPQSIASVSTTRSTDVIENSSTNTFHNTDLVSFPDTQNSNLDYYNSEGYSTSVNVPSVSSPLNILYERYRQNSKQNRVQFENHSRNPYFNNNHDEYSYGFYTHKPIKFSGLATDILKVKTPTKVSFRFPNSPINVPSKMTSDNNKESSTTSTTLMSNANANEEEAASSQEKMPPTTELPAATEGSPMNDEKMVIPSVANSTFAKVDEECKRFTKYGSQFIPRTTYITNGVFADHYEFPHMAALGYKSKVGIAWKCGGSLISDEFVITAAHCTHSNNGPIREVRLGDIHIAGNDTENEDIQTFQVAKTFVHPLYKPTAHYHDIAILQLDRPVNFSRAVMPACLQMDYDFGNVTLWATGWGAEYSGGDSSQVLQKVDLHLFSTEECFKKAYGRQRRLSNGVVDELQICAGYPEQRKDTCQGDSGGPLQIKMFDNINIYKVVGITSFGKKCEIVPGIYTRVSHYLQWIQTIVWPS